MAWCPTEVELRDKAVDQIGAFDRGDRKKSRDIRTHQAPQRKSKNTHPP